MKPVTSQIRLEQMRALRDAIHLRRSKLVDEAPVARPISFNDAMITALLAGRKTQTRRLMRGAVASNRKIGGRIACFDRDGKEIQCHLGAGGDQLWVRERWAVIDPKAKLPQYCYGSEQPVGRRSITWRPSFHMPRVASRMSLQILDVRAERLQSISESDAVAEGFDPRDNLYGAVAWFHSLWDELFSDDNTCWNANPWVWVLTFELSCKNRKTRVRT